MKRILLTVPMILLSALLLFVPAAAEEADIPQKTVTGVALKEDSLDRFLTLGETPDFSQAEFIVTYYDGSFDTVVYDESYLTSWATDKKGRQPAVLNVYGKELTEYFIVLDDSIDILRFTDVTRSYWGYRQIDRAVKAGFFVGMTDTEFGVAGGMTRAQFCQMIYHIYEGDDTVFTRHRQVQFTDVPVGKWYYEAVMACAESGIVAGLGDGTFCPDNYITRQDVAVIMMSVLSGDEQIAAIDIEAALSAAHRSGIAAGDFDEVSGYAKKYVAAALGVIYYGDTAGNINPHSNITRTECAAMCSNLFFKGYTENNSSGTDGEKRVVYLSPESDTSKVYAIWEKNDPVKSQYTEHIQMTLVAEKIKEILEQNGYTVYIADPSLSIRDKDNNGDPQDYRGAEAERLGADCYVALHTNAAGKPSLAGSVSGTTCFYNGNNEGAKELSDLIYKHVGGLTPTKDIGSLDDMLTLKPFAEVRLPTMANVLVEVEFHDYAPYATWIVNNIDNIAQAFAAAIDEYFTSVE